MKKDIIYRNVSQTIVKRKRVEINRCEQCDCCIEPNDVRYCEICGKEICKHCNSYMNALHNSTKEEYKRGCTYLAQGWSDLIDIDYSMINSYRICRNCRDSFKEKYDQEVSEVLEDANKKLLKLARKYSKTFEKGETDGKH